MLALRRHPAEYRGSGKPSFPGRCLPVVHLAIRDRQSSKPKGQAQGQAWWKANKKMEGNYSLPAVGFNSRKDAR